MAPRLNKNGIPLLDPPGKNGLKPLFRCPTPEDHDWGPPVKVRTEWGLGGYRGEGIEVCYRQTCRKCHDIDEYWREE